MIHRSSFLLCGSWVTERSPFLAHITLLLHSTPPLAPAVIASAPSWAHPPHPPASGQNQGAACPSHLPIHSAQWVSHVPLLLQLPGHWPSPRLAVSFRDSLALYLPPGASPEG